MERNEPRLCVLLFYNHITVADWKEKVCAHVTQKNSLIFLLSSRTFARFSYCCANEYTRSQRKIFHIFLATHKFQTSSSSRIFISHNKFAATDESSPRGVCGFIQWFVMSEEISENVGCLNLSSEHVSGEFDFDFSTFQSSSNLLLWDELVYSK